MNPIIENVKNKWIEKGIALSPIDSIKEIDKFELENRLLLPEDIKAFFTHLRGGKDMYDDDLFLFYSFDNFKSIDDSLKNWRGIPDYGNIVNTLAQYKEYYVFANYSIMLFSYAIRLYEYKQNEHEIIVICGDEYLQIANSFSGFLELYLNDSVDLYFNKKA